ncbi:MAG: DUF2207 domain-containing protein [Candidatus Aceula meridiana]|nr:DUF2207 domain-containing protein [Candidatus Aceula meridiana]
MRRKFFITIGLILGVLVFIAFSSGVVFAQDLEKILSFNSEIRVSPGGTLTVTETIRVKALGSKIKHGIYRDFPTRYKDRLGKNRVSGFQVLNVLRDGKPEPYHIRGISNGRRVYIGDPNGYLRSSEYTYTLTYWTDRQIGFFDSHDELYWNVTGNGWEFPIEQVSATVELPEEILGRINGLNAWVGYQGSREQGSFGNYDGFGRPLFRSTRPLHPTEGFTIAISWPKGYIAPPTLIQRIRYFLRDNQGVIFALFGLLVVLGYYVLAWYFFGRDPKKGTIIPLFYPPEKISPAMMRCIFKMGYDNKALAAAILNLAVQGCLKIEEEATLLGFGRNYKIKKTEKSASELPPGESGLMWSLLGSDEELELSNKNHVRISAATNRFKNSIQRKTESVYFASNIGYFIIGVLLSGGLIFLTLKLTELSLLSAGWVALLWLILLLSNALFYYLLKAPTIQGRKLMDKMEGFKMFLSVSEKDRMNMLNPPEKTPELFEKYLPFALALDVENKWAEQFSDVFERLSQQGTEYHPCWYYGSSWNRINAGGFADSLGSSFSGAIASSAMAPGSSSGFGGGGGFSGGGGGGGGGGGW